MSMISTETNVAHRLRKIFERTLPFIVALFCVILSMLPFGLVSGIIIAPAFALMAVFYWALYRPDLMPPYAVFFTGLYQDLLSGGPLGLWSFIYLCAYGMIVSQRLFFIGKAFLAIWFAFGIVAILVNLIMWGIVSLYYANVMSLWPIIGQTALSFALYPFMGKFFGWVQRRFLSVV